MTDVLTGNRSIGRVILLWPLHFILLILTMLILASHATPEPSPTLISSSVQAQPQGALADDERISPALSRFRQGVKECQRKSWATAIQLLSDPKVESDTPIGDRALFLLGDAQTMQNRDGEATRSWERLIKNWPDSVLRDETLKRLVDLYEKQGKSDRAIHLLKTGIDKREDPAMMMAAAGIYERQHRTDQAVALYRSILTAQPSSEAADSAQNRLGALGVQPFDPKNVPYKKANGAA